MAKKKQKKSKKYKKNFSVFLLAAVGALIIILIASVVFLFFQKTSASIYVFPENPKQGDTVFIRVKSDAGQITGNFEQEKLDFYRKANSNEWISFLGIDADQKPGDYKIFVDTSKSEHLTEDLKVSLADFSSGIVAKAPTQAGKSAQAVAQSITKNDNSVINKILGNFTSQPYFTSPFSDPLSKMKISGFPFGKFIGFAKYKLQHFGVDLQASEKTNIRAINDGKVVLIADLPNYGKTIIIDHGLKIFSLYLHLDEFKVSTGQIVARGQLIGLSGETGYVTAPHLHFSIRVDGSRVDPIAFIQTTQKINENEVLAAVSGAFNNMINYFKQ